MLLARERAGLRRTIGCVAWVACVVAIACKSSEPSTGLKGSTNSMAMLGVGTVSERYTAELWVRGTTAYSTTWGLRGTVSGNAVKVWDVSGNEPLLVDSLIVANAGTLGDVQTSDDGHLLAVAIEPRPNGGLALFSLADARHPQLLLRYQSNSTALGVHTAEIARVNGTLYAFCAIDPGNGVPGKLVTLDLTNPELPVEVSIMQLGNPYIHDVHVRDGMLFTAEWDNGVGIYDIGAFSGSPAHPVKLGQAHTVGGAVHNILWFRDVVSNAKRYLFVGEEQPGQVGASSAGDIHVVDIANPATPREVAVFSLPGAGTHNFSADETNGFLYAAYYNGGVVALDVRGDLGSCNLDQQTTDGRCDLTKMGRSRARFLPPTGFGATYVWGVQFTGSALYASDMLHGLWKLAPVSR